MTGGYWSLQKRLSVTTGRFSVGAQQFSSAAHPRSTHDLRTDTNSPMADQTEDTDAGSVSSSASCEALWRPEPTCPGIWVGDREDYEKPKVWEVKPEHLSGKYKLPPGNRWYGPIPRRARSASDAELAEKARRLKAEMLRIAKDSDDVGDYQAARLLREDARELEEIERELTS